MFKHVMPVLFAVLIVFLLVALLVGCTPPGGTITASGNVVTQEEALSGFDKVEVSHAFKVDVSQGETFSVIATSTTTRFSTSRWSSRATR